MKSNQISLRLAMLQMRFFNERPGSTKNNDRFYKRMWLMYPKTTARLFNTPYEFSMTSREREHREKPLHLRTDPICYVAWSAAWSAAESAEFKTQSDDLLAIVRECKEI